MLQKVSQSFSLHMFQLAPHGHSRDFLTSNRRPALSVGQFDHPQAAILDKKKGLALAVSSGSVESTLFIVVVTTGRVRCRVPVICRQEARCPSTKQKLTGLDIAKGCEAESGLPGSIRLRLMWLQSTADGTLFGKSCGGDVCGGVSGCGPSPLCETVEPERMSGLLKARVRFRNVCQVEASRPQCSAAGRAAAAARCRTLGKTQTCIRGFQLPRAVRVRSAYRRAWRWWSLPECHQGPPGWTI